MKVAAALIIVLCLAVASSDAQIKGVALLFRHGQRTPNYVFPTYGMTTQTQELGTGQLTVTGSKQLYEVGADLRKRYTHLFPASGFFRASNMRVMSSPVERCIMSLSSFMTGFFPPPAKDKTLSIDWQPFPFTVDSSYRTVIVNTAGCPIYQKDLQVAQAQFAANASVWLAEDKATLDRISAVVGVPMDNIGTIMAAFDLLQANRFLVNTIPQWLLNDLDNVLLKYTIAYARALVTSEYARKVNSGNLITEIIRNMEAIRDGSATSRNFLIYSGHDTSLSALAQALGVDTQMPTMATYGDTLAVELNQVTKAGTLEVQVVYVSEKKKTILTVPNCGKSCTLDKWIAEMSKYIVTDFNALCGL